MSEPQVTIILPTYREVESLPSLISAVEQVRQSSLKHLTLVIVDDNSADGTEALIDSLHHPWVTLIVRTTDRGLSSAVLHGIEHASTEICVVMDADGSHPASAIPAMIQALEDGADFVVGSRYIEGGETEEGWGVMRWLNSKIATLMARPFTKVLDPMSGFLAFKKSTYDAATDINPVGYKIGLELIVKCRCTHVVEVPIRFRNRQLGQSKLTFKVQYEYVQHVLRLLRYTHPKACSFFSFAAVGSTGAVVYVLTLLATTRIISKSWIATALAVWIAMSWNFLWDRKFAFWYARNLNIFSQYLGFLLVCSVGAFANFYITNHLITGTTAVPLAGLIGAIAGSVIGILFNFFASRLLVFRK